MSNDFGKQIMSILVDWYESSPAYVRNQKPERRRMMRLYDRGVTDFAAYNIENHTIRKDVNRAVLELADKNYIGFEWMRGQKDHIISRLWLNFNEIGNVYSYLGRRPKGDAADEILARLKKLRARLQAERRPEMQSGFQDEAKVEWTYRWLDDVINTVSRKRSPGTVLPADKSDRDDLLKTISFLAGRTEIETTERLFSIQCFGDSKRFERSVKPRLVRILKKYFAMDDCTDEEALGLAGIVRYPERFEFCGALAIILPKGKTDFSPLSFGGTLIIEDLKDGKIVLDPAVRRIISIENRANYIEYIRESRGQDELVLYHGGQFSPAKGVFLRAIASAMPDGCKFFHWGDIDYGGFSMLARLRREVLPDVPAFRMSVGDLKEYSKFAVRFSDSYRKRLASLLKLPELRDCFPCLEYMLEKGIRLEQEVILAYQKTMLK